MTDVTVTHFREVQMIDQDEYALLEAVVEAADQAVNPPLNQAGLWCLTCGINQIDVLRLRKALEAYREEKVR